MNFNKFLQSKALKITIWAIGAAIIMLIMFQAGLIVGFKKAGFSYRWGENYHRNFAGPRAGFIEDFSGKEFIEANGVFGSIIKIGSSTMVIKGRNDTEKIILLKTDTVIKRFQNTIKSSDLKANEFIVVIGSPNNTGQLEAKLIRVMPEAPSAAPKTPPLPFPVPPQWPR